MEHGADAVKMNDATAAGVYSPDESASCSASTMSKATPPAAGTAGMTVESRDELERLPYDRYELGIDGEGTVHFHSARADRVVAVAESGAVEETIDLSEKTLASYVAFVDGRRGWDDLNYAESFADILMEAL